MGSDEKGLSLWIEVESASVAVGWTRPSVLSAVHECALSLPPPLNDSEALPHACSCVPRVRALH